MSSFCKGGRRSFTEAPQQGANPDPPLALRAPFSSCRSPVMLMRGVERSLSQNSRRVPWACGGLLARWEEWVLATLHKGLASQTLQRPSPLLSP